MTSSSASTRPISGQRPVPSPSNPVLLATQAQWLFTDEELTRTPSLLDGMKFEAEQTSRSKGVNFIAQVGIMLKLPQPTLATAAVYMHRFFMRFSMVDLPQRPGMHPYPIAATSLFLAMKVEENIRRMKEIVIACCRVAQKQPNMVVDEQSKEFWKWRDTILHHEDLLLEALCFDLQLEQPYRILYDFICFFGVGEHKPLRNAAWAFVNDSTYTVLSLQFNARTIAAAALYAAARHCDIGFKDDDLGRPWWEQLDVDLSQVRRACMRIAQLYENNAMQKHSQYYPTTPITTSSDEGTEKTRIPRENVDSPAGTGTPEVTSSIENNNNNNNNNGRKRSREPEADARDRSESANPRDQGPPPMNGERTPKRQRTADAEDASRPRPSHHHSSTSTDPYMNGGHLAPPPPSYDRQPRPRQGSNGQNGPEEANVDPVQQRIDNIVLQNQPTEQQQQQHADSKYRRYSGDNSSRRDRDRDRDYYYHDRDRRIPDRYYPDRDRDRRRRPSVERHGDYYNPRYQSGSNSRGSQQPASPPPPAPAPPAEKEEGEAEEGSEEGEV